MDESSIIYCDRSSLSSYKSGTIQADLCLLEKNVIGNGHKGVSFVPIRAKFQGKRS